MRFILLGVVCAAVLASAASPPTPAPFTSDICSLVRDKDRSGADWSECCIRHDLAYWRGGTAEERAAADEALRVCRLSKDHEPLAANAMWAGVRVGGTPIDPAWFRWGYGWPYGRGYAPVTPEERRALDARLAEFCAKPLPHDLIWQVVCDAAPMPSATPLITPPGRP